MSTRKNRNIGLLMNQPRTHKSRSVISGDGHGLRNHPGEENSLKTQRVAVMYIFILPPSTGQHHRGSPKKGAYSYIILLVCAKTRPPGFCLAGSSLFSSLCETLVSFSHKIRLGRFANESQFFLTCLSDIAETNFDQ